MSRSGFPVFGMSGGAETVARDATYLDTQIRAAETRHFWFRARLRLVQWTLRRYFPAAERLLDVGCGTGFVLEGVRQSAPSLALAGCDLRIETLDIARQRVPGALLFAADMTSLPFASEFDVVTALDVLEHMDDDLAAFEGLLKVIKPGGGLILTVPQHPWLWSAVDDFSCHRRRYTRAALEGKARTAGFDIVRGTSFFAVTLPMLALSRFWRRGAFDPGAELQIPPALNTILGAVLGAESTLVRWGASLPFGSSLMLVARRRPA